MLSPAVRVALAAFALAAVGLTLVHHIRRPPVAAALAVRAALANPPLRSDLAGTHWNRVTVSAVDAHLDRVQFFRGARAVGEAAVSAGGTVVQAIAIRRMVVPYGDWIAYEPAVLAGLAALFVLMAGVRPWRRLRNLDVLAVLSLLAPVVLLEHRLPDAMILSALPGLLYLLGRCLGLALAPRAPGLPMPERSRPLWTLATAALEPLARVRLLRLLLAALALVYLAVGVSSTDPVDVVFAVMEGATRILHGVLPYGHMPGDIIHGDTYPLLTYVAYVPLAAFAPVDSTWSSVDVGLAAAVVAALASALGVAWASRGHSGRPLAEREAGLRAAVMWLAFPPLLVTVSTGTTDVAMALLLVGAVLAWRRPLWATGILALAAWFKLAPAVLLPLALAPLRGGRRLAAAAVLAAVSVPVVALLLMLGGPAGVSLMIHAIAYQFSRGSTQSAWAVLGLRSLQPLGEAFVLALVAGAAWRLREDPALAGSRMRIAALAAAVLISLQLSADYWAFLYLVWFMPLVAMSLLAPDPATVPATATAPGGPVRDPGGLTPGPAVA